MMRSKTLLAVLAVGLLAGLVWIGVAYRARPVPMASVDRRELARRDGRWFRLTETNAFTGIMLDHFPNGALMARSMISNGLGNGVSETWYTNGQIQMRESFRNGISDGVRDKWYENGNKMSEAVIVNGRVTGLFQSWHENGKVKERIEMKDGEPDGTAWAFYPSGFASAETSVREGKVLNRRTWKDGEYKSIQ